ncbi:MAG: matrixin family metalloprotease [Phycisphaerales bacterium]
MRCALLVRLGVSVSLVGAALTLLSCSARSAGTSALHENSPAHDCAADAVPADLAHRLQNPDPSLPILPADYSAPGAPNAVFACYDPANPPPQEVIQRVEETLYGLSLQFQLGSRWTQTATNPNTGGQGTPITLTWSFVPDGLNIPSGVGEPAAASNLFAQMDSKFGGNRALWIQRITDAFTRWGQLSGITYVRVTFGGNEWDDGALWGSGGQLTRRGDIRIAGKAIDGSNGILAYNGMPNQSDMVIDMAESWGSSTNTHRFLRNVVMHEHGHGLGFAHSCPQNNSKLMEPFLATSFDGPQQDEIRGVQRFYGDANEDDNASIRAADLGTRPPNTATTIGNVPSIIPSTPSNFGVPTPGNSSALSIDNEGEQDWFRFTLAQPLLVSVTLSPVGSNYLDGPQNGNGSCSAGTAEDAVAQANLRLQLFGPDGAIPIFTADANAAGSSEIASQILCPAADSFIRVSETAAVTGTQLYRFTITTSTALTLGATDGTFTDKVVLGWSSVPNALNYRVFRGETAVRNDAALLDSPVTNSYEDSTVVPGTTYFYWVQGSQSPGSFFDMAGPETGFAAAPPSCPADFNQDGNVDPDDLGDFINCFFSAPPCPGADFNQDSNVDPDDLGDYINTFFGPPC